VIGGENGDGKLKTVELYNWKTSGVNFTNTLHTAFTLIAPECIKKIDNLTVFFTLLGSARVKDVHRM